MDFGKTIKKERERQGLSMYRLAKMAGVTPYAVMHWEANRRSPSLENADKVLKTLGIEIVIGGNKDD